MVKQIRKRVLAMLMTLAMVVSLMPAVTMTAQAAAITGSLNIATAESVSSGSTEVMTRYDEPLYYKFTPAFTASYTITTSDAPSVLYR